MHHSVKACGDSYKAKSDICRSDTYLVISHLCNLCRETSHILVIASSSFSPICVAEPEEESTYCTTLKPILLASTANRTLSTCSRRVRLPVRVVHVEVALNFKLNPAWINYLCK